VSKLNEADNVATLSFDTTDDLPFVYKAGQYVDVQLTHITGRSKSYTISSAPFEKLLSLTVKRKGVYSSALLDLHIGNSITVDGPYGFLYPEVDCGEIVMIASGIGITPFYSIIKDRLKLRKMSKLTLFYSNKTVGSTVYLNELNDLATNNTQLKVIFTLTRSDTKHGLIPEYTRIDMTMLKKYLTSFDNKCYYICGSIQFVNDTWKLLKESGVSESNIFTESFF